MKKESKSDLLPNWCKFIISFGVMNYLGIKYGEEFWNFTYTCWLKYKKLIIASTILFPNTSCANQKCRWLFYIISVMLYSASIETGSKYYRAENCCNISMCALLDNSDNKAQITKSFRIKLASKFVGKYFIMIK